MINPVLSTCMPSLLLRWQHRGRETSLFSQPILWRPSDQPCQIYLHAISFVLSNLPACHLFGAAGAGLTSQLGQPALQRRIAPAPEPGGSACRYWNAY